jgi:soluble lytic murein transglycosylase-like protein
MIRRMTTLAALAAMFFPFAAVAQDVPAAYQAMVARHAAANGLPASLVHRVIMRESRYRPRAVSKGNYGIMQIRLGTARAMGYQGSAAGLLDPEVNMTYAVKYLAGAYRAARGNHDRAVRNYAAGYYYQAKAQGFSPYTGEPIGKPRRAATTTVASANPFAAFAAAAQQNARGARTAFASKEEKTRESAKTRVVNSIQPPNPLKPDSRYDSYEPVR